MATDPGGDFGGGWREPAEPRRWAYTMAGPPATWPPGRDTPRPDMPTGWQCGACGTVLAPWVPAHRCATTPAPAPEAGLDRTEVLNKTAQ
jgi:hypothetical protein